MCSNARSKAHLCEPSMCLSEVFRIKPATKLNVDPFTPQQVLLFPEESTPAQCSTVSSLKITHRHKFDRLTTTQHGHYSSIHVLLALDNDRNRNAVNALPLFRICWNRGTMPSRKAGIKIDPKYCRVCGLGFPIRRPSTVRFCKPTKYASLGERR